MFAYVNDNKHKACGDCADESVLTWQEQQYVNLHHITNDDGRKAHKHDPYGT